MWRAVLVAGARSVSHAFYYMSSVRPMNIEFMVKYV
jgi:hypothetical protein